MQRVAFFAYGVVCHLLFLAVYAWMIAFFGDFLAPKTINSGTPGPVAWAVAINLALVGLFGVQHSVMARPAFKAWWTRFVPRPIERSTYVLFSCIVTVLLLALWQPIDIIVWRATGAGWWLLTGLFAAGCLTVPLVSLMINHFDLFGTRQVWLHLRGRPYEPLAFRTPGAYAWVRHPLYVGWALFFWATPTMTLGHLLMAGALTGYMLLAVRFEERDLLSHFGARYAEYRRRVPMFWPLFGAARTAVETAPQGGIQSNKVAAPSKSDTWRASSPSVGTTNS
jgi:protein-S-isoprenylcysteine O-methyltransferase Ste14